MIVSALQRIGGGCHDQSDSPICGIVRMFLRRCLVTFVI